MIDIRKVLEKNRSEAIKLITEHGQKIKSSFILFLETPVHVWLMNLKECDVTAVRYNSDFGLEFKFESTIDEDENGWGDEFCEISVIMKDRIFLEIGKTCG